MPGQVLARLSRTANSLTRRRSEERPGLRIVVLLILQALWLESSHSGEPGSSRFGEERLKQEAIYHSKGDGVVEGYTVDRSLAVYAEGLCTEFDRTLANLGPKDRWLDIGAGKGHAILDYYSP